MAERKGVELRKGMWTRQKSWEWACENLRVLWRRGQLKFVDLDRLCDEFLGQVSPLLALRKPGKSKAQVLAEMLPSLRDRNPWLTYMCQKTLDLLIGATTHRYNRLGEPGGHSIYLDETVRSDDDLKTIYLRQWKRAIGSIVDRVEKEKIHQRMNCVYQCNQINAVISWFGDVGYQQSLRIWIEPLHMYLPVWSKFVHNHALPNRKSLCYAKSNVTLCVGCDNNDPLPLKCDPSLEGSLTWGIIRYEDIRDAYWMWQFEEDYQETFVPLIEPGLRFIKPLALIVCEFLFLPFQK